jgi:hypothetical protein
MNKELIAVEINYNTLPHTPNKIILLSSISLTTSERIATPFSHVNINFHSINPNKEELRQTPC